MFQKKWLNVLWIVFGVIVFAAIWFVSVRNSFITMTETINASWAQVENQMQRRYDLIPNLVNTVKGYAKHEQGVFDNIANARAQMGQAKTVGQKIQAANSMEGALSRLLMVVENYPNLKADTQFTRLMDELAGAENRLSVERRRYNEHIQIYNQSIKLFPKNLVAAMNGFAPRDYFQMQSEAKETPKVAF